MSQLQLDKNISDLQELLDEVNNLPEAGGGSSPPTLQNKIITENGTYTADEGYDGLGTVMVNVPIPDGYVRPSGTLEVTENGTYDVTEKESVSVNVASQGAVSGRNTYYTTVKLTTEENVIDIDHDLGVIPTRYWITADPSSSYDSNQVMNSNSTDVVISVTGTNSGLSYVVNARNTRQTSAYQTGSSYAIGGSNIIATTDRFKITYGNSTNICFSKELTYSVILMAE